MSVVNISSLDDVVISVKMVILSVVVVSVDNDDDDDGANIVCCVVLVCSSARVFINSTVVSGKVFVVCVVHNGFISLVVIEVTVSELYVDFACISD